MHKEQQHRKLCVFPSLSALHKSSYQLYDRTTLFIVCFYVDVKFLFLIFFLLSFVLYIFYFSDVSFLKKKIERGGGENS